MHRFLVIGATGKQGGAVVNELLRSPSSSSIQIIAPTRNPDSPSAKTLAARSSNIRVIKGDMENAQSIFKQVGEPVHAVFAVTVPVMGGDKLAEEKQGKALIDASISHGVEHFIFTSVDRGGDKSDANPTPVPHFKTKHNVEMYLKSRETRMKWTILRPVCFMDNFEPSFLGKLCGTWWSQMGDHKLQLIAAKDIGVFAGKVLLNPQQYENRAISLAGDELTFTEAKAIYKRLYGRDLPTSVGLLARGFSWAISDVRLMWKWFVEEGYNADIKECKRIHPGTLTFEKWLAESKHVR